jgi:hypothetical protein
MIIQTAYLTASILAMVVWLYALAKALMALGTCVLSWKRGDRTAVAAREKIAPHLKPRGDKSALLVRRVLRFGFASPGSSTRGAPQPRRQKGQNLASAMSAPIRSVGIHKRFRRA